MKLFKRLAVCAAFLMILTLSLTAINRILEPKYTLRNSSWPTTSTYNQFYKMERNSVDVLFFGSSVAASTFIPQVIYDEYGITSYNLGSEQQSIFLSYFWLREALRYQSPKVVVVDLEFMDDYHPESPINTKESITRKSIDPMRWSKVKFKAVRSICELDRSQSLLSYFLTNIRFHGRWKEIEGEDFHDEMATSAPLKGFAPISEYGPDSYEPYVPKKTDEIHEFQEHMQEYLEKIAELCRDNDISLMLVNLPGATMDDAINHTNEAFAADNGALYVNLCTPEHIEGIGASLPEENIIYHENIWGAMKTSSYVGKMLKDSYDLQAKTDPQYEESGEFFYRILDSFNLIRITDPEEYQKALDKPFLQFYETTEPVITVDKTDYRSPDPGRNIVVVDNNMNRVVDFATIQEDNIIHHQCTPESGF